MASDVARYDLGSSGESTQGAAAAAMLVQADPALLAVENPAGVFTEDGSERRSGRKPCVAVHVINSSTPASWRALNAPTKSSP